MKNVILLALLLLSFSAAANFDRYAATIVQAAELVGVEPAVLLALTHKETRFRNVRASAGGTAEGLLQITDRTWRHLLSRYANDYDVALDADKYDPWSNAVMAAAYLKENQTALKRTLRRDPTVGELYMAHLLGLKGAVDLFKADLNKKASSVVAYAYTRNSRLFKTSKGDQRTVRQFRDHLNWRFGSIVDQYAQLDLTQYRRKPPTYLDVIERVLSNSSVFFKGIKWLRSNGSDLSATYAYVLVED